MFETSLNPYRVQWLYVALQDGLTRWCHLWHTQRSHYPIPPGLAGPTVKLLLHTALPYVMR